MPRIMWPHLRHPRDVNTMADIRVKRWEYGQKERVIALPQTWPVVTISHETEEHGIELGRIVAERLGFGYWDRSLVMDLVHLLNVTSATSIVLDERISAAIEEFLGTSEPSQPRASADTIESVRHIINSIAHRGGSVLVGRGAQFLVDDRRSLRVRLVASLDVADPAHFDLAINTETYGREPTVGLILMAYFAKFGHWPLSAQGQLAGRVPRTAPMLRPIELVGRSY